MLYHPMSYGKWWWWFQGWPKPSLIVLLFDSVATTVSIMFLQINTNFINSNCYIVQMSCIELKCLHHASNSQYLSNLQFKENNSERREKRMSQRPDLNQTFLFILKVLTNQRLPISHTVKRVYCRIFQFKLFLTKNSNRFTSCTENHLTHLTTSHVNWNYALNTDYQNNAFSTYKLLHGKIQCYFNILQSASICRFQNFLFK